MKRMRVIISAPSFDPAINVSGISTVASSLINALSRNIHYTHITVGSPQAGPKLLHTLKGMANTLVASMTIVFSTAQVFHSNTALNLKSIVRDLALLAVARLLGKKTVLHLHGGRYLEKKAPPIVAIAIRCLFRTSDHIVVLSSTEKQLLATKYAEAEHKVSYVYNSVHLEPLDRSSGFTAPIKVAFIGRLVFIKGLGTYVAVARQFPQSLASFVVYGDGPLRDFVTSESDKYVGLTYAGVFSPSERQRVFSQIDVVVLPSVEGEGMPMVILEAMASGVIPIATSIGSIPEIVASGERGLVVEPGDVVAIKDAITKLCSSQGLFSEMQKACRKFAESNFNDEINSQKILEIYRGLVK